MSGNALDILTAFLFGAATGSGLILWILSIQESMHDAKRKAQIRELIEQYEQKIRELRRVA